MWFLQGKQLITCASNVYTFVANVRHFPSCIFTNPKNGVAIYDGMVAGFRLPKSNAPPAFLLASANARRSRYSSVSTNLAGPEEMPDSPPPNSPKSDPEHLQTNQQDENSSDEESLDARDAVFVDIRNQWVKCEFSVVSFCESIVAYQVTCQPIESIRYKSTLPYPFGGTNEYEWCRETFTLELIVLKDHLIARLVSYNLTRKDRSVVTMQYNTAFHKYARQGQSSSVNAD